MLPHGAVGFAVGLLLLEEHGRDRVDGLLDRRRVVVAAVAFGMLCFGMFTS